MNALIELLDSMSPFIRGACFVIALWLAHTLWQGALIAVCVRTVAKARRTFSASARFTLAFAMLVLIGSLPAINAIWIDSHHWATSPIQRSLPVTGRPVSATEKLGPVNTREVGAARRNADYLGVRSASHRSGSGTSFPIDLNRALAPTVVLSDWLPIALEFNTLVYAVGLCWMTSRFIREWRRHCELSCFCRRTSRLPDIAAELADVAERAAQALGGRLTVPIYLFDGIAGALVLGGLRPVILVSLALVSGLTPRQLEQIIAHELAHVYRLDHLSLFCQRVIESLTFFNPAMWYISRQVSELRELCCDDWVGAAYGGGEYAAALVRCAELCKTQQRTPPRLAMTATGTRPSQLATRVAALIDRKSGFGTRPSVTSPMKWVRPVGWHRIGVLGVVAGAIALGALGSAIAFNRISTRLPTLLYADNPRLANEQWRWVQIDVAQLDEAQLLTGGTRLSLEDSLPEDIEIMAMINEADCRIAQWHFGDSTSTCVAIVCEMNDDRIVRMFMDANRNRVIEEGEELTSRTRSGRSWVANLDVEMRDGDAVVHSARQIAITPTQNHREIRVSTLGYAEGTLDIDGHPTLTRRIDNDGDGIPNGARDQVCFDLDHNGEFDLIAERMPLENIVVVLGNRYAVKSDRLGQTLMLQPVTEQGRVRFGFRLADSQATVVQFEGCMRDEFGMMIPFRELNRPLDVPTGRYCISSLVLTIRDNASGTWHATLIHSSAVPNEGWFTVETDNKIQIEVLDSIDVIADTGRQTDHYGDVQSFAQPYVVSRDGLVLTDLKHEEPNSAIQPGAVPQIARFVATQINGNNADKPTTCSSGFA